MDTHDLGSKASRATAHLQAAVAKAKDLDAPDALAESKKMLILSTLTLGMEYSASGNSIPGLRGKGLQELLDLATLVLSDGFTAASVEPAYKAVAGGLLTVRASR